MSIPKFDEYFKPILECLKDGKERSFKDIKEYCATYYSLSTEEFSEKLPSGVNKFYDRVAWAKSYLSKALLLESPKRGIWKITDRGRDAINKEVTVKYLKQYKEFRDFLKVSDEQESVSNVITKDDNDEKTPSDIIENAIEQLNKKLASDLMNYIQKMDCYDFENLVNQLLVKMGYGKAEWNINPTTKKSGDEGIDGIVKIDKLGFDSIYTQAKLWKEGSTVGRPEIQKFVGAMTGHGATKGLFITTAKFSNEAYEYANKNLHCKVILIDGDKLADLMIEHELGVSTAFIYKVKHNDTDFFNED